LLVLSSLCWLIWIIWQQILFLKRQLFKANSKQILSKVKIKLNMQETGEMLTRTRRWVYYLHTVWFIGNYLDPYPRSLSQSIFTANILHQMVSRYDQPTSSVKTQLKKVITQLQIGRTDRVECKRAIFFQKFALKT
jgi:hypothetical protein